MQRGKSWPEFLFTIARIVILMMLLAVMLPKLVTVCSLLLTSQGDKDEKPSGNPMRVEEEGTVWSEFVIQLFPDIKR
ncbi:hypothetical protein DesLBE_5189 [Desulfitobacterium sp. LBE]|uniref:Uncharacterized protein n=3 Tax=root TaxID=1 RepID=A0A098B0J6_DESHA|nr:MULTISPECIES: hypothetical protein [Desulfitobacterium]MEA5023161.1 hypothetical protein [Desulfitobacterium hafniense]TWH60744.1 hypothetical protein DesLBE_5189 [Desulfitobacterium sp. LBE]CDX02389.1 Hypothetical protein DPCES_2502 [Desulfitobacterium hafniense]SHN78272.1 hypothetical protein SAMN02745215_03023 [Desulfitobacterium chlororespirans DSM 11544]